MRRFGTALGVTVLMLASCGADPAGFETLIEVSSAAPGDVIALRADGVAVEYIHRRDGTINRVRTDADSRGERAEVLATIGVATEGEQRGLLGHAVIGARRFAAWTQPDTLELVVGEVTSGGVDRIVWAGTATSSKAVGGHLEVYDGRLLLGLGSLTEWSRVHGSGALVLLDPDGPAGQTPVVLSDGWNNPFAFTVTQAGVVWVADNAPDGADLPVEERAPERIGHGDEPAARAEPVTVGLAQRAPSSIIELPDGRLGVCGFLDNEMWGYTVTPGADAAVDRAGTIGPCQSGAAVLDDGAVVTSSLTDAGTPALLLRPAS